MIKLLCKCDNYKMNPYIKSPCDRLKKKTILQSKYTSDILHNADTATTLT